MFDFSNLTGTAHSVWIRDGGKSTADVMMEIPVLVGLLKSSILISTSSQLDDTFQGVVIAAVDQSRCRVYMVA